MKTKIDLPNPLDPSTEKYLSKINVDQVRSFHLDRVRSYTNDELQSLSKFTNVNSITVRNPCYSDFTKIGQFKQYLLSLTQVHFSYDSVIDYDELCKKINRIGDIEYLKVSYSEERIFFNTRMQSVLFDLRSVSSFALNYFKTIEYSEKCMPNVRSIRVKILDHHVNLFLNGYEWKIGVKRCRYLKKITLEIYEHDPEKKKYLIFKAQQLETELRKILNTLQFRIVLL